MPRRGTPSDAMMDRVSQFILASMARSAEQKRAGKWTDEDDGYQFLHALIVGCLTGAESDERAENLMRLADDVEQHREASALARLLAGEVDLVAFFAERKEG